MRERVQECQTIRSSAAVAAAERTAVGHIAPRSDSGIAELPQQRVPWQASDYFNGCRGRSSLVCPTPAARI